MDYNKQLFVDVHRSSRHVENQRNEGNASWGSQSVTRRLISLQNGADDSVGIALFSLLCFFSITDSRVSPMSPSVKSSTAFLLLASIRRERVRENSSQSI